MYLVNGKIPFHLGTFFMSPAKGNNYIIDENIFNHSTSTIIMTGDETEEDIMNIMYMDNIYKCDYISLHPNNYKTMIKYLSQSKLRIDVVELYYCNPDIDDINELLNIESLKHIFINSEIDGLDSDYDGKIIGIRNEEVKRYDTEFGSFKVFPTFLNDPNNPLIFKSSNSVYFNRSDWLEYTSEIYCINDKYNNKVYDEFIDMVNNNYRNEIFSIWNKERRITNDI